MVKVNSNKGITIVEVVIAMALVIIISLAGFSVINFSISSSNKSYAKSFFIVEVQNYVTAIMSGSENYSKSMNLLTGTEFTYGENSVIYYSGKLELTNAENSKYHINISFGSPNSVNCYDNKNNLICKAEV